MKWKNGLAFGALAALTAVPSFAAFTPDKLLDAGKSALGQLKSSAPDHVQHVTGINSWKSGEDAKVKISMSHDGMDMEFDYDCQDTGTGVDCQAAQ